MLKITEKELMVAILVDCIVLQASQDKDVCLDYQN